jgi:hypothetical protein
MLTAKKTGPNNLQAVKPDSITPAKSKPANKSVAVIVPSEKFVYKELKLRKASLTKQLADAGKLTINGQEDKEGFLLLQATRKNLKALRITIEKICMAGRQPAIQVQDAWVALEKDYRLLIQPVENKLHEAEKAWELEKKAADRRKLELQDKAFMERSTILAGYGAAVKDGFLVLGDVSYDIALIREMDQETYEEAILPKYQHIYDEAEKKKVAEQLLLTRAREMKERIYKMRLKELTDPLFTQNAVKLQGMDYTKDALVDMADADWEILRDAHNKSIADTKDALAKQLALRKQVKDRSIQLHGIGFFQYKEGAMKYGFEIITPETMGELKEEAWGKRLAELKEIVDDDKKEKQRIAEALTLKTATGISRSQLLAACNIKMAPRDLMELEEEAWQILYTAKKAVFEKEKAEAESTAKAEALAASDDATQWNHFIEQLKGIQVPQLKSKKYKQISTVIAEKIKQILDVIVNYKIS